MKTKSDKKSKKSFFLDYKKPLVSGKKIKIKIWTGGY